MKIIKSEPYENGGRPPIQTWSQPHPPTGYYAVECDESIFVQYRGFVNLTVESDTVIAMTGNQEALDAYLAEQEEVTPAETEPTSDELLRILAGVTE